VKHTFRKFTEAQTTPDGESTVKDNSTVPIAELACPPVMDRAEFNMK